MKLKGNLVDVSTEGIYPAEVTFEKKITSVHRINEEQSWYILPGFIDSHIHIESSMLCPSRFAEAVIPHGTTLTISDPHEIGNVLGIKGINYMIEDTCFLKVYYTAPSCVPATTFETSGAKITAQDIDNLFKEYDLVGLGEVMNFPGVISEDREVIEKIEVAKKYGKQIDGHAPGLSGADLQKYIGKGISTDHECTSLEEAQEKLELGMKIMIREGTASKNLKDLLGLDYDECFLVSDDLHPEDIKKGHVDALLRKAVSHGIDPVKAVKMVTINPSNHYRLNSGRIDSGRAADIVLVDSLEEFNVKRVFIDGKLLAVNGRPLFTVNPVQIQSSFDVTPKSPSDFYVRAPNSQDQVRVRVITIVEGQLYTRADEAVLPSINGAVVPDTHSDILKLAVVERYGHSRVGVAFVKGFELKEGALASSVAHDSHNIIAVGVSDECIKDAVNTIIHMKGGIAACGKERIALNLPVAGLMSYEPLDCVAEHHKKMQEYARELGCRLKDPFMQLSFLALLVIPELKLSDKGLFDSREFTFADVVL
ncbi:MAG: adenine deaminase [Theionarchaea archaeon]|nr:adenine deaminase [Theionarchaea archaeon]